MKNLFFHSPYDAGCAVASYVHDLIQSAQRFEETPPCAVVVSPQQHDMLLVLEADGQDDRSCPPIARCENGLMLVYNMYVVVTAGVAMPYLVWSHA